MKKKKRGNIYGIGQSMKGARGEGVKVIFVDA